MPDLKIALVTTRPRPEINVDHDMPLLLQELTARGAQAVAAEWDDPAVNWAEFDVAVLRSTWDYTWRTNAFLAWVDRCSSLTRLVNPPSVVRWSGDKRYLGILAEHEVPVVRTRYLTPGDLIDLPTDHEYVVKPAVGAGARFAARYQPVDHDTALRHVQRMHAEGLVAMVQPYMTSIDTSGERALVFLRGKPLHAVRKRAVLSPGTRYDDRKVAHPGLQPWSPTPAELATAKRSLDVVPGSGDLLYARVDMVSDENDDPVVMELELVEPNLFLSVQPASLPIVADAIIEAAAASSDVHGEQPVGERL